MEFDHEIDEIEEGVLVRNQWFVEKSLGGGAYGTVWRVLDRSKNGNDVPKAMKVTDDFQKEVWALELLNNVGSKYVPELVAHFPTGNNKEAIVMSLADSDLSKMKENSSEKKFSKRTSLTIAFHALSALQDCHKHSVVHRDVKLANLCAKFGPSDSEPPLFLVDFNVAESVAPQYLNRLPDARDKALGQSKYCSPLMSTGACATPLCDVKMLLYSLMEGRGIDIIYDRDNKYGKDMRVELEKRPEEFIKQSEDGWLLDLAKFVFSTPTNANPDHVKMLQILKTAEPNFDPETARFMKVDGKVGKVDGGLQ